MSLESDLRGLIRYFRDCNADGVALADLERVLTANCQPAPKASICVRRACGHKEELADGENIVQAAERVCDACEAKNLTAAESYRISL